MDLSLVSDADAAQGAIVCRVETLDRSLDGFDATLSVVAEVEVRDSRPVHDDRVLYSQELRLSSIPTEIRIPRDVVRAYTYSGRMIRMKVHTRLVVDDAILFDTKISEEHDVDVGEKPVVSSVAKSIVEPPDSLDFFKNLKAIPPDAQLFTLGLVVVGGIVIAVNTLIGVHDQMVPEAATWLYGQVDSEGDSSSPLLKSLIGSGGLGLVVWLAIGRQLRRYMEFGMRKLPRIRRGRSYAVQDLVRGRSRVPLEDVTLRVVACNMEMGQYVRGSGTDKRTVSFKEPTRAVILYQKRVERIAAQAPIAPHFDGPIDFGPMFATLYPPFTVSRTHGLSVHWEVQLLHPEFVDQELAGPPSSFHYEDFLKG